MRYSFSADEVTEVYLKRFGSVPPRKVVESMAYWDLPNDQRAPTAHALGQLVRLMMDHLLDAEMAKQRQRVAEQSSVAPELPATQSHDLES
jgi:hypothetical protein